MRLVLVLLTVIASFLTIPATGRASECDTITTPCEAYLSADAVFVGTVTRITPEVIKDIWTRDQDYDQLAYISVAEVFKGSPGKQVVFHQLGRKNAPKFVLRSSYLFYAHRDRQSGQWWVQPCSRSRMADYTQDDFRYLRSTKAEKITTRIAGEVSKYEVDPQSPAGPMTRLAGITIHIFGPDREYTAITDDHGVYELLNIPPGKYRFELAMPKGLRLWAAMHYGRFDPHKIQSLEINLPADGCSGITIILTPGATDDGKIGN